MASRIAPRRDSPVAQLQAAQREAAQRQAAQRQAAPRQAAQREVAQRRAAQGTSEPEGTGAEVGIRARRRRMLTGLIALAALWALFAAFWAPVLWWPQIVLDLIVFGYLVFLRLEAQREQDREERRRARDAARVRLPEDRTERVVRAHTQYQAQVTAATEQRAIALDDDDPNLAEIPTWQQATATPANRTTPAEDEASTDWSSRKAV